MHLSKLLLLACADRVAGRIATVDRKEAAGRQSPEGDGPRPWLRAPAAAGERVTEAPGAAVAVAAQFPWNRPKKPRKTCDVLDDAEWHLKLCHVPEAWEYSRSQGKADQGEGIVIASPDTGYSYHTFANTATAARKTFTTEMFVSKGHNWQRRPRDDNDAEDPLSFTEMPPGHGTMVTAIMAGRGTEPDRDGNTVRGVAPKAKVLPLRIVNSVVFFDLFKLREAIVYAKDNGAHIISTSLGTPVVGATAGRWKRAVVDAIKAHMILVSAGGQIADFLPGTDPNMILPASYHNVIALGAVNQDKKYWDEGWEGENIAFVAPGEDVCVARAQDGHNVAAPGKGTSLATAFTAGTAALWLAHHGRDHLIAIAEGRGEHLQDLFCKAVEISVQKPEDWKEDVRGAGIVDARALLMLDPHDVPLGQTRHCKIDITERGSQW